MKNRTPSSKIIRLPLHTIAELQRIGTMARNYTKLAHCFETDVKVIQQSLRTLETEIRARQQYNNPFTADVIAAATDTQIV